MNKLSAFKAKNVQGLYHYYHYERQDGAWFQVSIDPSRREVTYCPSPSKPFLKFRNLDELKQHLEDE
jgi:hypothetical protein